VWHSRPAIPSKPDPLDLRFPFIGGIPLTRYSRRLQVINPFHAMNLLRRSRELERSGMDIVHMEIGEPDFPTPAAVVDAGIRTIAAGDIKYTVAAGLPELRAEIAGHYAALHGINLPIDRIFITPGGAGALLLAFAALVDSGDEVLMADPCYPCNRNLIRLFDGEPRLIPVGPDSNYQLNASRVDDCWGERTSGILIASPSNPTGTMIDLEEIKAVIDVVESHSGFAIFDEIYHGLHYERRAETALNVSDQVFVVNSFSKYFGMTGWRLGWIVVPEAFVEPVERLAQNMFISAPSHSQAAALAAFRPSNIRELETRRSIFRKRRDFVMVQLVEMGFEVHAKPQGAFYVYAGCRNFTEDSFDFSHQLLENHGLAVTPGKDFGLHQPEGYVRFAYTTSMERLELGMERLRKAVRKA